ncbi:hypothetical protein Bpfe_019710, partial [Biomphalaria pfeifferi]
MCSSPSWQLKAFGKGFQMDTLYLVFLIVLMLVHMTDGTRDFDCSSPQYDRAQTPQYIACRLDMCVTCHSNITYQELNYTLAIKINETVVDTVDKNDAYYSVGNNGTLLTFPLPRNKCLYEGPAQFQFSMSAVEQDGNMTNETIPWTAPEYYSYSKQMNLTINGQNNTVIVNIHDILSFQCTVDGYPTPVVLLNTLRTNQPKLFSEMVVTSGHPVNYTADRFVVGYYTCKSDILTGNLFRIINVLCRCQLRTHDYQNNVADIDVQSIDVDFYDNLVTFRVFGYPGPRTMYLSSNEVIFDEGVHLSHETASKNSSYDIKIMFLNQSLLKRYNVFNVTVNNGYYTSIYTLQCTVCSKHND